MAERDQHLVRRRADDHLLDERDAVYEALSHELLLEVERLVVLCGARETIIIVVVVSTIDSSAKAQGGQDGVTRTQQRSLVRTVKAWKRRSSRRKRVVMEASTTGQPFLLVFSLINWRLTLYTPFPSQKSVRP